jgi:sec-independent protein translocase protein TatC
MAPGEMFFIEHLNELRVRFLRIIIFAISIVIFSSIFGIQMITVNNHSFYFFYPAVYNNIASQITFFLGNNLLPEGVKLIQTAPGQSLFAQITVSILLGITSTIPIIVKEIFGFISPAISKKTQTKTFFKFIIPITVLFLTGIIFSFFIAIPVILTFLYQYGQSLGILSFLNINEFVSFVLQFFIAFGISFQLPLIMYIISLTGLVGIGFWLKNFRYALIAIVIFGALITPDGSGITMWFISFPMLLLYFLGILLIKINVSKDNENIQNK